MEERREDTIIFLCSEAVSRTDGIEGLSGGITESLSRNILGRSSPTKGIKVSMGEGEVTVGLFINVRYDVKIPEVAWNLQENVKKEIEKVTDCKVKAVNIHVQGVAFEDGGKDETSRGEGNSDADALSNGRATGF